MSTTITIDAAARVFTPATDPAYRKQLDRGDTKLAVAAVVPTTNLLLSGTSHLLKTHAAAGNNGRRSVASMKDDTIKTDGTKKRDTCVITGYTEYNDEDSVERSVAQLAGLYAYLSANDFAEWRNLLRGGIDIQ